MVKDTQPQVVFFDLWFIGGEHSTPDLRFRFLDISPQYLVFFINSPPLPLVSRQVVFFANIAVLPAHKMTNFRIYSKLPPPISSKKRFQPQSIEISGCCISVFCIFSLLWGHPPFYKSSSRVFCQNSSTVFAFIGVPAPICQIWG